MHTHCIICTTYMYHTLSVTCSAHTLHTACHVITHIRYIMTTHEIHPLIRCAQPLPYLLTYISDTGRMAVRACMWLTQYYPVWPVCAYPCIPCCAHVICMSSTHLHISLTHVMSYTHTHTPHALYQCISTTTTCTTHCMHSVC